MITKMLVAALSASLTNAYNPDDVVPSRAGLDSKVLG